MEVCAVLKLTLKMSPRSMCHMRAQTGRVPADPLEFILPSRVICHMCRQSCHPKMIGGQCGPGSGFLGLDKRLHGSLDGRKRWQAQSQWDNTKRALFEHMYPGLPADGP